MVLDFIISVIILILNNTFLRFFPTEIDGFSIGQFQSGFHDFVITFANSFNIIQVYFDLHLLLLLLGVILTAEFMLHFGFKGIKYLINVIRGSGA
jgi:hypothetical protein